MFTLHVCVVTVVQAVEVLEKEKRDTTVQDGIFNILLSSRNIFQLFVATESDI